MSPRRLDADSIHSKLRLMEPLLEVLEPLTGDTSAKLAADRTLRLAVERVIILLVDLATAVNAHAVAALGRPVPADYRDSFFAAAQCGVIDAGLAERIAPSAGLRIVLVHRYGHIDNDKVDLAVPAAHDDYRTYIQQVSKWLLDRSEQS